MGRPPLKVKPTVVRLAPEDLERIDALEGPNKRAKFIREAVKEKLNREGGQGDAVSRKQSNNSSSD
ncbi:hypothetical protein [Leisingera sp. F5]|uniref:hypothetical protein n=1 Tax=Leisingera sp. F5 TaxID=1813816 RepID=UPI0025C1037E|nr:hypothetical protein [Leisingera sp. F5]